MAWYDALRDVIGCVKDKQEAAIVYHLLKNGGQVEQTANELNAPQATVVLCRDGLERAGYLKLMAGTFDNGLWRCAAKGKALLKAMEADRGEVEDAKT